jgi:hypothetical protein
LSKLKTRKKRKLSVKKEELPDLEDFGADFDNVTLDINDAYDDEEAGDYDFTDEETKLLKREKTLEELMDEEEETGILMKTERAESVGLTTTTTTTTKGATKKADQNIDRRILADSETAVLERSEDATDSDKVLKWPFDMDKVNIEPEDFNDYKKKSEP